jgi:oxepin-CoA hydrolase/3-oxo-5,6-dehydrosuberyl-CoA semialdehyde dehydrogenase
MLKALAKYLLERKELFYELSARTGATRADSWVDIEGGIGTVLSLASIARRELPDESFIVEGETERLSAKGSFLGRHILVPKEGVSVHINAFNFPCWGMLEKIAPSLIAGVPVVVKPATVSAYVTEAMVREMMTCGILPAGSVQLICGGVGDLFEHLTLQDSVTFTGSASTGRKLKSHHTIVANSSPFNMEADSLNCSILGAGAEPGSIPFDLFIKGVAQEITVKAGQKCTAIRRIFVPEGRVEAVIEALKSRLDKTPVGDPANEGVRMGCWSVTSATMSGMRWKLQIREMHGGADLTSSAPTGRGHFFPPPCSIAVSRSKPMPPIRSKRSAR